MIERILLLACCILLAASTAAQPRPDEEEEAAAKKPWIELELKLPAFPKPENLLRFEPNAWSSNRFYIDPESISVDSDGVARYTLVIKSAGGAENISYEGIRCETVEQKFYASGRRDGTWSPARASAWRRIEYREINRQHAVLYADYFCPDRKLVKSSRDAVNRLKYGAPRSAGGSS